MKNLIEKLRLWLISRLNAVPMEEYMDMCIENLKIEKRRERETTEYRRVRERFQYAIREICRRSETTYYSWCCDICRRRGDGCKANGWCERFWPGKAKGDE